MLFIEDMEGRRMTYIFDYENCTRDGVPCDCRDCTVDKKCRELECSICDQCDEYWPLSRCLKKQGIEVEE